MPIDSHLILDTHPLAPEASIIRGEHYRITVLTERLLRLEYAADGVFEDRATQVVLNRDFEAPAFTLTPKDKGLQVRTKALTLEYDGREFTPGGLMVTPVGGTSYHQIWRYGEKRHDWNVPINLGGTARTLDAVDGPCELEPGIMATVGVAALDDSASLALTDDGWVDARRGDVDVYVFAYGFDYAGALRDFYRLTGPTPLLPRYALGNWWSRYHAYTADEYAQLLDTFEAENLPFSIAVIDMDWHHVDIPTQYGSGWTGYTWNDQLFPDPKAFLADLHRRGLAATLNLHPADGVRGHEDAYRALAARVGVDAASEEPVVFDIGNPDFVGPYLEDVHHPMEDDGVDFWWIDWQQGGVSRMPGLDPLWALNHFHYLDNGRSGKRPLVLSRYAGPGSHRYPIGFSGDTVTTWESLAFQPYFTATASNIGYGWWSHDIGGHMQGYRDSELTARWFQLGVFSPINRLHSTNSVFATKEPWRFDKVTGGVMADFLRLRHRLLPYLYTMNERAHTLGEPLVRPLYYADARRETFLSSRNTFLFGTELLVAPITSPVDPHTKHAAVDTWLPAGEWIDFFTGLRYDGGRTLRLHRPIETLPVLARAGAIVPLTAADVLGVGNPEALEIVVFAGADGRFELYEDDDALRPRTLRTLLTWSDADGALTIHPAQGDLAVVPATRRYTLRLVGGESASGSLAIEVGEVATATGAVVRLDRGAPAASNAELARIEAFLLQADIGVDLKEGLWAALASEPTFARRMQVLEGFGLDAPLRGVIAEILLANPS
jgi:alpha-glucosidase (family GH31 glycosyl hydrolase)